VWCGCGVHVYVGMYKEENVDAYESETRGREKEGRGRNLATWIDGEGTIEVEDTVVEAEEAVG